MNNVNNSFNKKNEHPLQKKVIKENNEQKIAVIKEKKRGKIE